ncbi:MAG: carbohydrate kinase family protein, partial [Spirochaetales bacterium]|nr:carbohydrate kinase family protein [Spirochaetales bacterium]
GLDAADGEYGTAMARLLCRAREEGFRTSVDVVTESGNRYKTLVPPALKYTDYLCINETEAQNITDIPLENLSGETRKIRFREACEALKKMGVARWAIIHSPDYCAGLDETNVFSELETIPLPKGFIRGSVGAGDAFVSGVLYSLYREESLQEALKLGEATAVSSLSEKGGTEGVGALEEILARYRELGGRRCTGRMIRDGIPGDQ